MVLTELLLLPVAFLVALVVLFVKKRREAVAASLVLFLAAIGTGVWAIAQSRSSTAAIGIIFLPLLGTLAGMLGLAFGHLRVSRTPVSRVLGWVALVAALAIVVSPIVEGARTIQRNRQRDAQQAAHSQAIARNRSAIAAALLDSKGRESEVLNRMIEERMSDRAFLIPALESRFVSVEHLDRLASAGDLGIALQAVRNPNCPAATLTRIYRTHTYPDYFFQALAGHANTPPEILRELYGRPRAITGLDSSFARNPSTPADIMQALSTTRNVNVIQSLLQNPRLDCALLAPIEDGLKSSTRPGDGYSVSRIAELRATRCR